MPSKASCRFGSFECMLLLLLLLALLKEAKQSENAKLGMTRGCGVWEFLFFAASMDREKRV